MTRYTPQWLQAGSYPAGTDRRLISAIWPAAAVSGCAVTVQTAMTLNVAPGQVVVPTANSTGSVLCSSDAVELVTLTTAPASGQNRIDLVTCAVASTDIGTAAGDAFTFTHVDGVAATAGSEAAPAVPAGSVAIAQVKVIGGSASISGANITDRRSPMYARDTLHAQVNRNAAYTLPGAANTAIPWDTVVFDASGMWVAAQNNFVVPVAGIYLVTFQLSVTVPSGGAAITLIIWQNGAIVRLGVRGQAGNYNDSGVMTHPIKCAAGDKLQAGGGPNIALPLNTGQYNYFGVDYLGTG